MKGKKITSIPVSRSREGYFLQIREMFEIRVPGLGKSIVAKVDSTNLLPGWELVGAGCSLENCPWAAFGLDDRSATSKFADHQHLHVEMVKMVHLVQLQKKRVKG